MACGYDILFGYSIDIKGIIITLPYSIPSTGTYNGKDYYTWYDETTLLDLIIRWDNVDNRWEFGYLIGGEFTMTAYLDYPPSDCPVDPGNSTNWVIVEEGWIYISTEYGTPIIEPVVLTEEQECFPILVWNKQCEFGQCVYKYLQMLQFGSVPCGALEKLKEKRRILEILNCYDTRDIPNNTTDYNTFSYTEIKKLLNH